MQKHEQFKEKLKNVEALPVDNEDEFYGTDLLDALPSSDNIVEDSEYNVNEE